MKAMNLRRELTPKILKQAQEDLHEASKPFVDLIVDIYATSIPIMFISRDGKILERTYKPETVAQIDKIKEMWQAEQKHILDAYGIVPLDN